MTRAPRGVGPDGAVATPRSGAPARRPLSPGALVSSPLLSPVTLGALALKGGAREEETDLQILVLIVRGGR